MKHIEKYIIVCKWVENYANPIILKKTEKIVINLAIKETEPEWENKVWCITDIGVTGWVPIRCLKRAIESLLSNISEMINYYRIHNVTTRRLYILHNP